MAKQKRWAVRAMVRDGNNYYLFVGPKPRRLKNDWNIQLSHYVGYIPAKCFEVLFPSCCLPPGGGPVEIRFADEE